MILTGICTHEARRAISYDYVNSYIYTFRSGYKFQFIVATACSSILHPKILKLSKSYENIHASV